MMNKLCLKKCICTLLSIAIILAILPAGVSASAKPWDPYTQYLPDKTPVVKRQLRAAWICTVINMDWPYQETKKLVNDAERIQKSKDELINILNKAVEMKLNAVFFQVSPEGDAFYKSDIVPWSRYLTGTFGKDPGFDPLAFAIEEAHKRNLELHAWFNPYRVSMDTTGTTAASLKIDKSVYKEHPEWIKSSMSRFIVDPGIPEARNWVINRVNEVVNKYDVDGIHFDDYFYYESYNGELKDDDTYKKYNQGQFSNKGDWRRNNTYLLVKELSSKLRASKPWIKFGISPSGVWGNKKDGHIDGSNTNTTYTNYEKCFADTKKWVEEELLDYIAPQIYFSFANPNAPFGEVASWWSKICKGKKVHLYIGEALYKINDDPDQYFKGENAVPEFSRQLKFNMTKPEIMGSILFRMQNFNNSGKQQVVNTIKNDLWATRALVPVMPWKGGKAPAAPTFGRMSLTSEGLKLSWTDNDPNTAYYAVYRFNKGENISLSSDTSATKLIATIRKGLNGVQEFTDTTTKDQAGVYYMVTALDRLHNESSSLTIKLSLSAYFSDIDNTYSWAVNAVDSLYEKGVVAPDIKGNFNPSQYIRRGELLHYVVKALNLKANFTDNFSDVKKGSPYYESIGIAKALGIAKGNANYFKPDTNIIREDMLTIMVRAVDTAGIKLEPAGNEYLNKFSDASLISSYAKQAAARLVKAGIITGAGGKLAPKQLTNKAEAVVILYRILNIK